MKINYMAGSVHLEIAMICSAFLINELGGLQLDPQSLPRWLKPFRLWSFKFREVDGNKSKMSRHVGRKRGGRMHAILLVVHGLLNGKGN